MLNTQLVNETTYKGINIEPIILTSSKHNNHDLITNIDFDLISKMNGETSTIKSNALPEYSLNINEYGLFDIISKREQVDVIQGAFLENIKTNHIKLYNTEFEFTDDVWDFTSEIPEEKKVLPDIKAYYSYTFIKANNFSHYYQTLIRLLLLSGLIEYGLHRPFIHNDFEFQIKFIEYLNQKNIATIELISLEDITEYFNQFNVKEITLTAYKSPIKKLFAFYYKITGITISEEIIDWLNNIDTTKSRIEAEQGKLPLLPQYFMSNLVIKLNKILFDDTDAKSVSYKVSAGLIYIASQTGLRPYELMMIPYDCLKDVSKYGIELQSFTYYSTKNIYGKEKFEINTYATKEMINAIKRIQFLVGEHELLCGKLKYNDIKKTFNAICITYADELGNKTCFVDKNFAGKPLKDSNGMIINRPLLKQFRVYVNSELKRRGVSSFQIAKIFGHHDEKMLDYYERTIEDKEDDEYTNMIVSDVIEDETIVLGPKGDEYTSIINQQKEKSFYELYEETAKSSDNTNYFDNNDLNTKVVKDVVSYMKDHYPIRELSVGCCIRPHVLATCENSRNSDDYMCAYGLCANQCHFYFDCIDYYNKFKEWIEIILYNVNEGHIVYAEKELFKMQKMITNKLIPELDELQRIQKEKGTEYILKKHEKLKYIINNFKTIESEVYQWKQITIKEVMSVMKNV